MTQDQVTITKENYEAWLKERQENINQTGILRNRLLTLEQLIRGYEFFMSDKKE